MREFNKRLLLDLLFMPMSVFFPAMIHEDFHWKNSAEEHQWEIPMGDPNGRPSTGDPH